MSLYDHIMLFEPLPCFQCYSTIDIELEKSTQEHEIDLGGKKPLKIVRLHDGKGGIKNFQTHDLDGGSLLTPYYYPGFIRKDALGKLEDMYRNICLEEFPEIASNLQNEDYHSYFKNGRYEISIIEICNACDTSWEGKLFYHEDTDDNILITDEIEISRDDRNSEDDFQIREEESEFYKITHFSSGKVIIKPNIENAIINYIQEKNSIGRKIPIARQQLDTIDIPAYQREKIISKLENYLRTALPRASHQKTDSLNCYRNPLANAIVNFEFNRQVFNMTTTALETALILLYYQNRDSALSLIDQTKFFNKVKFVEDQTYYEWFFTGPLVSDYEEKKRYRILGCLGGPNDYLGDLTEIVWSDEWKEKDKRQREKAKKRLNKMTKEKGYCNFTDIDPKNL